MTIYDEGTLTSTSTPISINSYNLSVSEPTDVFEFDISSTSNINLNLHDITSGDDADLRLFRDSNGNDSFDLGIDQEVTSSRRASNLDDSINRSATAGTYFAQVERYATGSAGDVTYDLDISVTSPFLPSNLLTQEVQVGDLSGDRTMPGDRVDTTDTADVYAFSLGLYEGTNINLTGLSADADIQLIQDRNNNDIVDSGEVVGSSTRGGTSPDSITGINDSGNYLLEVYSYNNANTNYQLAFDHYPTSFA